MIYCRYDTVLTGTWVVTLGSSGLPPSSCPSRYTTHDNTSQLQRCLNHQPPLWRHSFKMLQISTFYRNNVPKISEMTRWKRKRLQRLVHDADDDVNGTVSSLRAPHEREAALGSSKTLLHSTHQNVRNTETDTRGYSSRALNT